MVRSLSLLILWALVACAPSPGGVSAPLRGAFALQDGVQRTNAFMRGRELWFTALGAGSPIRRYDLDMTKYLHAIVISDDFRSFAHLHPKLEPNGQFVFQESLPRGANHVFADAVPHGFGDQVFRFDVPSRDARPPALDLSESNSIAAAGPYVVRLNGRFRAGAPSMLIVHISRDGAPAKDLHPYLGALAHAVFVQAGDLSYIHVHPMALRRGAPAAMSEADMARMPSLAAGATSAPAMGLQVHASRPGIYKLWLQFRGGARLYAAPFVLKAS